tara:strand:- start:204 stop:380 length:177 start_codon:yes stop_codon:yes gene_type:complete
MDICNGARFIEATAGMNNVQRPGPEMEVSPVDLRVDIHSFSVNALKRNEFRLLDHIEL